MKLNQRIERLDPYSEERDAFATALFGESVQLAFDPEGRVTLPPAFLAAAHLSEQVTIVGKGEIFEIWDPKAFEAHVKHARDIMKAKRSQLRGES